jgi:hypothetical protein
MIQRLANLQLFPRDWQTILRNILSRRRSSVVRGVGVQLLAAAAETTRGI